MVRILQGILQGECEAGIDFAKGTEGVSDFLVETRSTR